MSDQEFPPNSAVSRKGAPQAKKIERVTSGEPVRRKKSLRKQFSDTFVAGDARTAMVFVVLDVLLPAVKDTIVEMTHQGIEKLIYGDSSRRRGSRPPQSGPTGYVSYNRLSGPMSGGMNRMPGPARAMSRAARGRHNFDEIVLNERTEAEEVTDRLFDLVSRYDQATVADLYELVGLEAAHTDHKWGWEDLHGAGVSRVRGGYLLDLPEPEPLD